MLPEQLCGSAGCHPLSAAHGPWLEVGFSGSCSQVSTDAAAEVALPPLGFICVCGDNNELALEQGGQET